MVPALSMHNVFKKFSRGEKHDSLRDLIPALVKRAVGADAGQLEEKEFWALQDVSFDINPGESVAFVGHNGAGKSTILKLLSGIMKPTKGQLAVNGRLSALIEVGAGFHPDLTGRENVYLNGVMLGMKRAEIRRKFDEIVQFAALEDFIDTPVKRYSSGMYARLGFAVAAHLEPDILVIDEVLSVGDQIFQSRSLEKMRSILNSGATVIFVSHNLRAVTDLCSRAIMLRRGTVVEDGPSSQVIHTYLEKIRQSQSDTTDKDLQIESAQVFGEDGPRSDFESGERAWLNVRVRAKRAAKNLVCALYVLDKEQHLVSLVTSEALGERRFSMQTGESRDFCFEVALHLPAGSFGLCAMVCDAETMKPLEWIEPATTLLMRARVPMQGVANLYPRLVAPRIAS